MHFSNFLAVSIIYQKELQTIGDRNLFLFDKFKKINFFLFWSKGLHEFSDQRPIKVRKFLPKMPTNVDHMKKIHFVV